MGPAAHTATWILGLCVVVSCQPATYRAEVTRVGADSEALGDPRSTGDRGDSGDDANVDPRPSDDGAAGDPCTADCCPLPPVEVSTSCADSGGVECATDEICLKRPFVATDVTDCCPAGNCFLATCRLQAEAPLNPSGVTLDGNITDWEGVPRHRVTKVVRGAAPSSAADFNPWFALQWDNAGLYVLAEVTDDVLVPSDGPDDWEDDTIEVNVDMHPHDPQQALSTDNSECQMVLSQDNSIREFMPRNWNAQAHFATVGASSWRYEFFLPWPSAFPTPVGGDVIGFDLAVDDDDGEGGDQDRECQLAWNDPTGHVHDDARHFGIVRLRADGCQSALPRCGDDTCAAAAEACRSFPGTIPWCEDFDGASICPNDQCTPCAADCGVCP